MSIQRRKISVINSLVKTGVERPYTSKEQEAIERELFGDDWAEHERMKAEGTLDDFELDFEEEEEFDLEYNEDEIEEDDPETEELLAESLYGEEEDDRANPFINAARGRDMSGINEDELREENDFTFPDDLDKVKPL